MIRFPNDYYDITDLISADINGATGTSDRTGKSIIPYASFAAMVDAGAIFLPAGGRYNGSAWLGAGTSIQYVTATATSSTNYKYCGVNYFNSGVAETLRDAGRGHYRPVRLIRTATPDGGDNTVNQGDDWTWDLD